jgi:hypothetical protein
MSLHLYLIYAMCSAHLVLFDLFIEIIFGEEEKL